VISFLTKEKEEMVTKTRKTKTTAEIKAALAAAKKKVLALEQRAYEGELTELIKGTHFITEYSALKKSLSNISDVAVLSAIAKAVGAKRIQVTQTPPTKRTTKTAGAASKTTKPKSPTSK
jgi:hypothetical protein